MWETWCWVYGNSLYCTAIFLQITSKKKKKNNPSLLGKIIWRHLWESRQEIQLLASDSVGGVGPRNLNDGVRKASGWENTFRFREDGAPRERVEAWCPFPLSCPVHSSICLFLSSVLYNKIININVSLRSVSCSSKSSILRRGSWEVLIYSQWVSSTGDSPGLWELC